jgi:hypothetical protein
VGVWKGEKKGERAIFFWVGRRGGGAWPGRSRPGKWEPQKGRPRAGEAGEWHPLFEAG